MTNFVDEIINRFLTFQVLVSALAIAGVFTTIKLMFKRAQVGLWEKPWFQGFIMTPMNLVLGAVVAIIPGWFFGDRYVERMIVGVAVGFLSLFLYTMFKKRVAAMTGVQLPALNGDQPATPTPTGDPK